MPLKPPEYFDKDGEPHPRGIAVTESPLCRRCLSSPTSLKKLEKHAEVLKSSYDPKVHQAQDDDARHTCRRVKPCRKKRQPLPQWMTLLPSNVNSHIHPPEPSTFTLLRRRLSYPQSSAESRETQYYTPFEWPPVIEKGVSDSADEGSSLSEVSIVSKTDDVRTSQDIFPELDHTMLDAEQPQRSSETQVRKSLLRGSSHDKADVSHCFNGKRRRPTILPSAIGSRLNNLTRHRPIEGNTVASSETPNNLQRRKSIDQEDRNPLVTELTSFFASRKEKRILPSRASRASQRSQQRMSSFSPMTPSLSSLSLFSSAARRATSQESERRRNAAYSPDTTKHGQIFSSLAALRSCPEVGQSDDVASAESIDTVIVRK